MMQTANLLIELLSEEIPARMQLQAAADFKRLFTEQFKQAQITWETIDTFVGPRRLVLVGKDISIQQRDRTQERRGPRVNAPTKAIEGFLKSAGLSSVSECEQRETDKGTFLFATQYIKGLKTCDIVPDMLTAVIKSFPWPKVMRWSGNTQPWVRPLHSILCLFGDQVVPGQLDLGEAKIKFGNCTLGHRFMAPNSLTIKSTEDYWEQLERALVLVCQGPRKKMIQHQIKHLVKKHSLVVHEDPKLLDEVTGLVEWPQAMLGNIEPEFMSLPREVLVTSMRVHQKYFALEKANGELAPHFIVVANIKALDGGTTLVKGNERVLRARLADAQFFYDQDRKYSLEEHGKKLDSVIFHAQLGSLGQKIARMQGLAEQLAPHMSADVTQARRAALLCKSDLLTEMVGEFPELQGIMGSYYATHDGEPTAVAQAIADHYKPRGPQDNLPTDSVGDVVALADKLDTLAGFFAVGIKPTGTKDPYALRRTALGIIRIAERHQDLNLMPYLTKAYEFYTAKDLQSKEQVLQELKTFLLDRLKVHWREQGQRHDHIAAVFAVAKETPLALLHQRVLALQNLMYGKDAVGEDLLSAYKRACNIVRIEEIKDNKRYNGDVNTKALVEPEELKLHQSLVTNLTEIESSLAQNEYSQSMTYLANLKPDIDAFFDKVLVNAKQEDLRINRLKLLAFIRDIFNRIADFGVIEGTK
ncbi:MAG: glycine--tRNA ligase subunit beta [Pseudomonadota bacterium]